MLVNMGYNIKDNMAYHAIVCTVNGKVVFSETRELQVITDEGKYWEHLRLLKRVLYVLNNLVQVDRGTVVTIALNSSVLYKWLETGAQKPYKYAVEELLDLLRDCKYEVELIYTKKSINNPAVRAADPKYVKKEKLQSVTSLYS
jgi:hypothetical protein